VHYFERYQILSRKSSGQGYNKLNLKVIEKARLEQHNARPQLWDCKYRICSGTDFCSTLIMYAMRIPNPEKGNLKATRGNATEHQIIANNRQTAVNPNTDLKCTSQMCKKRRTIRLKIERAKESTHRIRVKREEH
jgi:hypothetical protein